jgi:hypothetical protein
MGPQNSRPFSPLSHLRRRRRRRRGGGAACGRPGVGSGQPHSCREGGGCACVECRGFFAGGGCERKNWRRPKHSVDEQKEANARQLSSPTSHAHTSSSPAPSPWSPWCGRAWGRVGGKNRARRPHPSRPRPARPSNARSHAGRREARPHESDTVVVCRRGSPKSPTTRPRPPPPPFPFPAGAHHPPPPARQVPQLAHLCRLPLPRQSGGRRDRDVRGLAQGAPPRPAAHLVQCAGPARVAGQDGERRKGGGREEEEGGRETTLDRSYSPPFPPASCFLSPKSAPSSSTASCRRTSPTTRSG